LEDPKLTQKQFYTFGAQIDNFVPCKPVLLLKTVLEIEIGGNSTVLKLQKLHAPKNISQLTRKLGFVKKLEFKKLDFCNQQN